MSNEDLTWHLRTLSRTARELLGRLQKGSVLSGFYLAGGTGLALRLGHRKSADLDFISEKSFDVEKLLQRLHPVGRLSVVSRDAGTLHCRIDGIRVSFLEYRYPLLRPLAAFEGVPVADPLDVACRKIAAIAGRGSRRDFIDLYVLARAHGLQRLLDLFGQKFAAVNYSLVHVLKSLTWFEDAEVEPMPQTSSDLDWETVKRFFVEQATGLL